MTEKSDSVFLCVGKRRVLSIERDGKYPQMWRVLLPDGQLSDMANLTHIKDAALDIAEGIEARKNPHKSPLKLLNNFSWSRLKTEPSVSGLPKTPSASEKPAEVA